MLVFNWLFKVSIFASMHVDKFSCYVVHPEITEQPENSTVTTPMVAQFRCVATGVPRPVMEWFSNNASTQNRLVNGSSNNVMIVEVPSGDRELLSMLTLTTTTHPDDSRSYTCRAVNIVDDHFSNAILNVLCKLKYSFKVIIIIKRYLSKARV